MSSKHRQVSAGEFKTHCLRLMEEVSRNRISLTVTKRGKPLVRLVPYDEQPISLFGAMQGTVTVQGDIIAGTGERWEGSEDEARR